MFWLLSLYLQLHILEVMAALRMHGPTSVSVCKSGMWAIRNLAKDDFTRTRLRDAGACEGIVAHFISYSRRVITSTTQLLCHNNMSDPPASKAVTAMSRLHGPTNAAVCEALMEAFRELARDSVASALLTDASACEGSITQSIVFLLFPLHTSTSVALKILRYLHNLLPQR